MAWAGRDALKRAREPRAVGRARSDGRKRRGGIRLEAERMRVFARRTAASCVTTRSCAPLSALRCRSHTVITPSRPAEASSRPTNESESTGRPLAETFSRQRPLAADHTRMEASAEPLTTKSPSVGALTATQCTAPVWPRSVCSSRGGSSAAAAAGTPEAESLLASQLHSRTSPSSPPLAATLAALPPVATTPRAPPPTAGSARAVGPAPCACCGAHAMRAPVDISKRATRPSRAALPPKGERG